MKQLEWEAAATGKSPEERSRVRSDWLVKQHRKAKTPYDIEFMGTELTICEDVFCPAYGDGSLLLAKCLEVTPNDIVLDMGTGSGALAILAGKTADKVIGTDISSKAVQCARNNVLRNGAEKNIEIREGNLFSCIAPDEKFLFIIFNPPFLDGPAEGELEHCIWDQNHSTLHRFLDEFPSYLKKGGRVIVVLSSASHFTFQCDYDSKGQFKFRELASLGLQLPVTAYELTIT